MENLKNKNIVTPNFYEKCYELLKQIPKGKVTTYKELAHGLNCKAYRAVGTAMAKNPNAIVVPCHRVINSNGNIGNYAHGAKAKIKLLQEEGIEIVNNKVTLNKNNFHKFKS